MAHKYKEGEELYYVCPFVFIIEKVKICFVDVNEDNGELHYIEQTGGYLKEWDLVRTLPEAKAKAREYLQRFVRIKEQEIKTANPTLDMES